MTRPCFRLVLDRHFAALSAAAISGVVGAAQTAQAEFVGGFPNLTIPNTVDGVYLNFVTGVASANSAAVPGWDINPWGTTTLNIWADNPASPNAGILSDHPLGTSPSLIDSVPFTTLVNNDWLFGRRNTVETTGLNAFQLNGTSSVGVRFFNEATGQYNFGFVLFELSSSLSSQPRRIAFYGYDNEGFPLKAGWVPEPGALALLAAGAAGLIRRRQRT